jgi:hypothetical protein
MGKVISLGDKRNEKILARIKESRLKDTLNEMKLNSKLVSQILLDNHPISRRQKAAGRILYGYVKKEHIFSVLSSAGKAGYLDLYVERTAIYGTPKEIRVHEDCFAVYGIPPKG